MKHFRKKLLHTIIIFVGVFFILGSDDLISPEITILGDNPLYIIENTEYSDPGATAIDDIDGEVEVTSEISVDTSKKGKYFVVYTAIDSQKNKAKAVRDVYVISKIDTDPPIIKDLNRKEIGKKAYLRYSISDINSGFSKERIKVTINDIESHPYDVSYYNDILYVKRDHLDEFGGNGSWDLGKLKIDIEVTDKAGNTAIKTFNYMVFERDPLETIKVTLSVNSTVLDEFSNIHHVPITPSQVNFSFSAIANAPIVKYEWKFAMPYTVIFKPGNLSDINDFDLIKKINAGKNIPMDTYIDSYAYGKDFIFFVLLKVTDGNGHYGFAKVVISSKDKK